MNRSLLCRWMCLILKIASLAQHVRYNYVINPSKLNYKDILGEQHSHHIQRKSKYRSLKNKYCYCHIYITIRNRYSYFVTSFFLYFLWFYPSGLILHMLRMIIFKLKDRRGMSSGKYQYEMGLIERFFSYDVHIWVISITGPPVHFLPLF